MKCELCRVTFMLSGQTAAVLSNRNRAKLTMRLIHRCVFIEVNSAWITKPGNVPLDNMLFRGSVV